MLYQQLQYDRLSPVSYTHLDVYKRQVHTVNQVVGDGNLVERFLVHKLVVVTIVIEILVRTAFYAYVFQLFTDVEACLLYTSRCV